jgi:hypothetical protein
MAALACADLRVQWVDTTSADLDQDLMASGLRNRNINLVKRPAWAIYYVVSSWTSPLTQDFILAMGINRSLVNQAHEVVGIAPA